MNFAFMMSSERSGSNLLTRLMNAHSAWCGPSPVHVCRYLAENRLCYGELQDDDNWQILLEDTLALLQSMTGLWHSQWDIAQLSALTTERNLGSFLRALFLREAQASDKQQVFLKENHTWRFHWLLQEIDPQAAFVLLVRDPRDMALSWKQAAALRGGVLRAAAVWRQDQQENLKLYSALKEQRRAIMLRYEDLVREPERVLEQLCCFLGHPSEPGMLGAGFTAANGRIARRASDWRNLQKPVMRHNVGKFACGLSEEEIRYVEWHCREIMTLLGYEPVFPPLEDPAVIEARLQSIEPFDKPAWQEVSESEKQLRRQRSEVLTRIASRPKQPLEWI